MFSLSESNISPRIHKQQQIWQICFRYLWCCFGFKPQDEVPGKAQNLQELQTVLVQLYGFTGLLRVKPLTFAGKKSKLKYFENLSTAKEAPTQKNSDL